MGSSRLLVLTALVSLAVGAAASPASGGGPPPNQAVINEYIEIIPTSGGGRAGAIGSSESRSLPPALEKKLRSAGHDKTAALEELATSATFGTPQETLSAHGRGVTGKEKPSALGAAANGVSDIGNAHIVALVLTLIIIVVAVLFAADRTRIAQRSRSVS